jgi:hypothetical protein
MRRVCFVVTLIAGVAIAIRIPSTILVIGPVGAAAGPAWLLLTRRRTERSRAARKPDPKA